MIFGFGEDDDEAGATDEVGATDEAGATDEDGDAPEGTDTEAVDTGDEEAVTDAGTNAHESGGGEPDDGDTDDTPDADTDASDASDASDGEADEGDGNDGDDGDDGDVDPESISTIDRIVLDPEALVGMLAYNGQEDIGQKSKAVYSLRPPFAPAVEPTMKHLEEKSTEGKADDEIHLRPFRFVVEGRAVIEQRPTRQVATEEMDAEDPTDAAIEAWIDEAMETWKNHVRENFAESVDIFSPHGMAIVNVEYEPEPEAEPESESEAEE